MGQRDKGTRADKTRGPGNKGTTRRLGHKWTRGQGNKRTREKEREGQGENGTRGQGDKETREYL